MPGYRSTSVGHEALPVSFLGPPPRQRDTLPVDPAVRVSATVILERHACAARDGLRIEAVAGERAMRSGKVQTMGNCGKNFPLVLLACHRCL